MKVAEAPRALDRADPRRRGCGTTELKAGQGDRYTPAMRFRCIVSYRTSRSKSISTWRTSIQGKDLVSVTGDIVSELKRRQRRRVTVVGIYLQVQEAQAAT
jgi:hypothetical protein